MIIITKSTNVTRVIYIGISIVIKLFKQTTNNGTMCYILIAASGGGMVAVVVSSSISSLYDLQ